MRMRMHLYLVCLALIGAVPVYAQSTAEGRVIIKAGPVFSTFWGDIEDIKFENRNGWSGGIEVAFPLGKGFAIQPGVLYSQKGATATRFENDNRYRVNYFLDYLEIPILASFTTPSGGRVRGQFFIGPFVAPLLREKISGTFAGVPLPEELTDELGPDDGFFPVDGGGIIGAGLLFYITETTALAVDIRYSMSAVPLDMDDDFVGNRAFSVSLGLSL